MIWATTQHYADFDTQIRAVLGAKADRPAHFEAAKETLEQVFLGGLLGASGAGSLSRRKPDAAS